MKKSFSTGLVILLPIVISIWLLKYIFDFISYPVYNLLKALLTLLGHEKYFEWASSAFFIPFVSRIIALLIALFFVTFTGFIGRKLVAYSISNFTYRLIAKIPLLGKIYRISTEVVQAFFNSDQKPFKETVLIPFPSEKSLSLGFVTGNAPSFLPLQLQKTYLQVFIPTAPHPISGYLIFCDQKTVTKTPISIEEAIKFLISCGSAPLQS